MQHYFVLRYWNGVQIWVHSVDSNKNCTCTLEFSHDYNIHKKLWTKPRQVLYNFIITAVYNFSFDIYFLLAMRIKFEKWQISNIMMFIFNRTLHLWFAGLMYIQNSIESRRGIRFNAKYSLLMFCVHRWSNERVSLLNKISSLESILLFCFLESKIQMSLLEPYFHSFHEYKIKNNYTSSVSILVITKILCVHYTHNYTCICVMSVRIWLWWIYTFTTIDVPNSN